MTWITQLQNALNYIEAHLTEPIAYEDAARAAYMSPYSFHRTFSLMAGMTASEYIRFRRLSLAAQELRTTSATVLDIALKYGYESPESFAKAFSRFHGVSPRQARIAGTKLRLFAPLVIRVTLEGGNSMDYRMEHIPAKAFLTLTRTFSTENSLDENGRTIPDFWTECYEKHLVEPLRSLLPAGKRDLYGLCSPAKAQDTHFVYGIGILITDDVDPAAAEALLAKGYILWQTEAAEYAVFSCKGDNGGCIGDTWDRFFREFLPQTGYQQTDLTDWELYPEIKPDDLFCELYIPVNKS